MTKLRAVLKRRWTLLVVGVVLGMVAGALSSMLAEEQTDVTKYVVSQLIISNPGSQRGGNIEQAALKVTRGAVADNAARSLGESDVDDLAAEIKVVPHKESASIEVTTAHQDPAIATKRVSAFVDAFLEVNNGDLSGIQQDQLAELQTRADQAQSRLQSFNSTYPDLPQIADAPDEEQRQEQQSLINERQGMEQAVASAKNDLQLEQLNAQASVPFSTLGPDAPKVSKGDTLQVPKSIPFRMGLLGLFGLGLAVGLVVIIERLVPRIDIRDELVEAVALPVLAEVGHVPARNMPRGRRGALRLEGAWTEPYRFVRAAIQFVQAQADPSDTNHDHSGDPVVAGEPAGSGHSESVRSAGNSDSVHGAGRSAVHESTSSGHVPRVFMMTSPSPGEGKSTTTALTAMALAETGEPTLIVGGDFRRPSVHELVGAHQTPGIREHAQLHVDRPSVEDIVQRTHLDNLWIVPSGESGKEVIGLAEAAKVVIRRAVDDGATVLVDTSPVGVAADAIDFLPVVDQVILVVRSGRTVRRALLKTVDQLYQHGASIMGTVLIGPPGLGREQYYYAGYYEDRPAGGSKDDSVGGSEDHSDDYSTVDEVVDRAGLKLDVAEEAAEERSDIASSSPNDNADARVMR